MAFIGCCHRDAYCVTRNPKRLGIRLLFRKRALRAPVTDCHFGVPTLEISLATTDRSCYFGSMGNAVTTRQRIMDRGLALVSRYGLGGLTLGVLAEDVGMSKSGLFAHFESKDEMQIFL